MRSADWMAEQDQHASLTLYNVGSFEDCLGVGTDEIGRRWELSGDGNWYLTEGIHELECAIIPSCYVTLAD